MIIYFSVFVLFWLKKKFRFFIQMDHVSDIPDQIKNNVPVVSIHDQQPSSRHQFIKPSWKILLRLWSSTKQQLTRDHLVDLCSTYTEATLDYLQDKFRQLTSNERACKIYQLVFNMLCIFDVSLNLIFKHFWNFFLTQSFNNLSFASFNFKLCLPSLLF